RLLARVSAAAQGGDDRHRRGDHGRRAAQRGRSPQRHRPQAPGHVAGELAMSDAPKTETGNFDRGVASTVGAPPIEKCRSCSAEILWAITALARKAMPIDVEPSPTGNLVLYWEKKSGA